MLFSRVCMRLVQSTKLDPIRCGLIGDVNGRVLELGPGPGTNFRCWENGTNILTWTGVEPNTYFAKAIDNEKTKRNIAFETDIVWLNGENIDVAAGSFDAVVGTHVLCSVDDVTAVLDQVDRALKVGGTYYFMEHVAADDQNKKLQTWQGIMAPFFKVIGNGCQFKALGQNIALLKQKGYDIRMEHIEAPVELSVMSPHIVGSATKTR